MSSRLVLQTACDHGEFQAWKHYVDGKPCPGGSSREVTVDIGSLASAALAWLHEHDMDGHATLMDREIDKDALAAAFDALAGGW